MTDTSKLRQEIDEVLKECDGLGGALALHLLDATVLYGLLQQARDALPVWVPVSERLPEKNGMYLILDRECCVKQAYWSAQDGFVESWGFKSIAVTHWMSLPPAPDDE